MGIFGPVGDWIEDKTTDLLHKVTGAPTEDEKRHQQKMMNDQIKSYREQTEITRKELAQKKDEMDVEKRRVEQKQIRHLRHNYAAQGFLGSSSPAANDMNSKLGG